MASRNEIVRLVRVDADLSQGELAQRAGTSQPAISAIEAGSRSVGDDLFERILRAADARPSILLAAHRDEVLNLASEYGLTDVRVFGSVVHGEDTTESDVDVLAHLGGAFRDRPLRAFGFPIDAEQVLGFPVDLVLDDSRGAAMPAILEEAVPL